MDTYAQTQVNLVLPNHEVRVVRTDLPFPDDLRILRPIASHRNGLRRHRPCRIVISLGKNDDINPLRPPLTGLSLYRCHHELAGKNFIEPKSLKPFQYVSILPNQQFRVTCSRRRGGRHQQGGGTSRFSGNRIDMARLPT